MIPILGVGCAGSTRSSQSPNGSCYKSAIETKPVCTRLIATLAEDKVIIFDAFSILADSQGMMSQEYEKDELHLNNRGYEILNQELVPLLNKIKT